MADNNVTEEEVNSLRIVYLLKRFGTRIVQEVLLHYACKEWNTKSFEQLLKDGTIQTKLKNSVGRGVFKFQWKTLFCDDFPNIHLTDVGGIHDFDITLCFCLLKILCPPKSKWKDLQGLPSTNPTDVEMSVSVIKFFRNSINHEAIPKTNAAEFEKSFDMIQSCILTILHELSNLNSPCSKWQCSEAAIEAVRKEALDPALKKELNDTRKKWIDENRMIQQILEEMSLKFDDIYAEVKETKKISKENNTLLKRCSSAILYKREFEGKENYDKSSSDSEMYTDEKTRSLPFGSYMGGNENVEDHDIGDSPDSSLGKVHGILIQKVKARSKQLKESVEKQEKKLLEEIVSNARVSQQHKQFVKFQCMPEPDTSRHIEGIFGQMISRSADYPMKFEKVREFAYSEPIAVAVGSEGQIVICMKHAIYVEFGLLKKPVTIHRKVKAIAIHGNQILALDSANCILCAYSYEGVLCGEWNLPKQCHGNILVDFMGNIFISSTNYDILKKSANTRDFVPYFKCIDFPNNICSAPFGLMVCEFKESTNIMMGSTWVRLYQSKRVTWECCLFKNIPLNMFYLQHICCFKNGAVLVSDFFNHKIYQLSSNGKYVACVLSQENGITEPNSLAINTADEMQLVVGTTTNIVVFNVC